ncbi:MAG TPA: DUF1460 domain-containing protein [Prolixibacteraceae bacterium]|nr:DUF1460 domain-containing protein [Prolixibacteraceae bacterium]
MRSILLFIFFLNIQNIPQTSVSNQLTTTENDSLIFIQKKEELKSSDQGNLSEFLVKTGCSFINSPYVGKTLEKEDKESLVVNLRELDCTTFVETCIAFTLTVKSGDTTFDNYKKNLQKIRYRDGKIENYDSRLHYFSDWINDNQKKGIVTDLTKELGGKKWQKQINFMSTHVASYMQLKKDSTLIPGICKIEEEISARDYYYIPKEEIKNIESKLEEGMIVGITTDVDGLDIAHTGILVKENGKIHLLHASSTAGKVTIGESTFVDYLLGNKRQTGIMVLKLN